MTLAPDRIDQLAAEIAALDAVDRVKLMSAIMERDGGDVDWAVIAAKFGAMPEETAELHHGINETVREVRRGRRQSE